MYFNGELVFYVHRKIVKKFNSVLTKYVFINPTFPKPQTNLFKC